MNEKDNSKKRSIILLALSIISVFGIVIIWQIIAPFMIDNDNIYLKTIASGEMTGTPESHMYYMGAVSGGIISFFYKLTGNGIPWFGFFICISFSYVMIILLYKAMDLSQKIWQSIIAYIICNVIFISFFYQYFAKPQFTLASGFSGAGALLLLSLLDEKERTKEYILKLLPFLALTAWSLGSRDKAFFMIIPFFGMVFVQKFLDAKEKANKKNFWAAALLFALSIGFVFGINKVAYSSLEWKEFKRYTDASEKLFDYEGFPDYDSHSDLYADMGIKKSSYEAINQHYNIIMDPSVNGDNLTKLADIAKNERIEKEVSKPEKMLNVLGTIFRYNFLEYQDRPINILVYLLYAFVFISALVSKKYKALRDIAFILVARMFDWIYLVWNGRFPFRVTQIIYIAEFVLLVAIIIRYRLWEIERKKKEDKIINPVFLAMLLFVLAAAIRFGIPVMRKNYESVKSFRQMSVCFEELEDYMEDHSNNFYFFDMSHLYYMEELLLFKPAKYENYVYMGSWMPNSPWYNNKMREWGIDDPAKALLEKENVFIVYQEVDFDTRDFLDYYFEEHYPGTSIEVVDTFVSSNGFKYEILKPKYN